MGEYHKAPVGALEAEAAAPEKPITDYFGCRCGEQRNLSMQMGIYRCHGCGDEQSAQTLEGRKAAGQ